MTPQEKAKELVYQFTQTNGNAFFAKECALIAVDEIINSEPRCPSNVDWDDVGGTHQYYYEAQRRSTNLLATGKTRNRKTMKQTAVEWFSNKAYELFEQYSEGKFDRIELNKRMLDTTNKAKEMAKEHIIDFAKICLHEDNCFFVVEQKYNETFKS